MKEWLLLAIIGCSLSLIIFIYNFVIISRGSDLEIIFCDVGQGDATLIQKGYTQLLVDFGPDEKVIECLRQKMPAYDSVIELAILSHPDLDHFGGFTTIASQYEIKLLAMTVSEKKTDVFKAFKASIVAQSIPVFFMQDQICFPVFDSGELCNIWHSTQDILQKELTILPAETLLSALNRVNYVCNEDCNDLSLVTYFKYDKIDLLLTGDIGEKTTQALLDQGMIKDVDILKVPHHGAKLPLFDEMLDNAIPEISIISCGANNRYNHPHPDIISSLESRSGKIFRTDLQGTISFSTDGVNLWQTY